MQDRGRAGRGTAEDRTPGISPVRAFFLLGAVAAIVPLTVLATRPEAAPTQPPPPREPDYSLTNEEAIAEFERLNAQLMAAYRERNIALAEAIFTSDSPMLPRVRKEIRTLLRTDTISLTRFRDVATSVTTNHPDSVVVKRIELLYPRFETETGQDARAAGEPQRQEVEWTLRLQAARWLLHEAVIVDVEALRKQRR